MGSNQKRDISLLSVVVEICAEVHLDRLRRVTEGLIDDELGGFETVMTCVDQIFWWGLLNIKGFI